MKWGGPWRAVRSATSAENQRRVGRSPVPVPSPGWHWRLVLDCAHAVRRPGRQRKVDGVWEDVPAPRRVRCEVCKWLAGTSRHSLTSRR